MIAYLCLGHPSLRFWQGFHPPVETTCAYIYIYTMAAFNRCSLKCAIMACTDHRAVIVSHDLNIEHIEHIVHIHQVSHKAYKHPSTNNSLVSACSRCVACWKAWIWKNKYMVHDFVWAQSLHNICSQFQWSSIFNMWVSGRWVWCTRIHSDLCVIIMPTCTCTSL